MVLVCSQCRHTNPAQAQYCYFDGMPLSGRAERGPVAVGHAPFPMPLVLPNGQSCQTFNQMAIAFQNQWNLARDLLCRGMLGPFFRNLGRHDLAQVADQGVNHPDPDRVLDDLLAKVPNDTLQPPRLRAEPRTVNLGQLAVGRDGRFEIEVANQGMRLLAGAIGSDCDWLVLGDGVGQKQKLFHTPTEIKIPVQVVGKKLRAGAKPLEGRLLIDTNGGQAAITVKADIPIQPFAHGVLAGAVTPRDLAVKAKAKPKDAALLFEQGLVQKWYQNNGWTYPVQGPTGSGIGAVQQFFEALGLVKPPRVEVADRSFNLQAQPGERLQHLIHISTPEKRPVFAHGWSDQDWLKVGQPVFEGSLVRLPIEIVVPPRPGEQLRGNVNVRANGNQRFTVPVSLQVKGTPLVPPPSTNGQTTPILHESPTKTQQAPVPAAPAGPAARPPLATFGMGRLVYWSGLLGGWSAFVGWLLAELILGSRVNDSLFFAVLMVVFVGSFVGMGLSQVQGLITGQWKNQLGRLAPGLLGGFLGGLVGGFLGNLLFLLLGQRFVILGWIGRVLGWILLGVAIGICEGLLERHGRKFRNGLIGGSLGGFLGGVIFNPVSNMIGSPVSSRAVAFVLLGLFIGLFLGLVQVLLKEAWLTVETGFRPGRQLILDQETTTMGTSEKSSLIFIAYGAKGVEPTHLKILRLPGGTFVLEDNHSRTGTLLNGQTVQAPSTLKDGDLIQFGINRVRFQERLKPKKN